MRAAVLAVQGAFAEHEHMLDLLGVPHFEIREESDLRRSFDALILPGGESTVQGKLLRELSLYDDLKERILAGLPVLGTCAGMILLASTIDGEDYSYFATMPVSVTRNAYGRQLGSFKAVADYGSVGPVPMTFIRAPLISKAAPEVEILAKVDNDIAAVRYKNQTALAFHPELNTDLKIYRDFLSGI